MVGALFVGDDDDCNNNNKHDDNNSKNDVANHLHRLPPPTQSTQQHFDAGNLSKRTNSPNPHNQLVDYDPA